MTADQIVDDCKAAIDEGTVLYAWEFVRPIPRDTDKALQTEFLAFVSGIARDATKALIALGLTDHEIETRMATVARA